MPTTARSAARMAARSSFRDRDPKLYLRLLASFAQQRRHLFAAIRYVEHNPVRAGLMERPEDYRWSSAAAHLTGKDRSGVLDMDFWQQEGGAAFWAALLATPVDLLEMRRLEACTFGGRPFGQEEFVIAVEQTTGRRWRRSPCQVMHA